MSITSQLKKKKMGKLVQLNESHKRKHKSPRTYEDPSCCSQIQSYTGDDFNLLAWLIMPNAGEAVENGTPNK